MRGSSNIAIFPYWHEWYRDGEISSEVLGISCVAGPTCFAVGSVNDDTQQFSAVDCYS